MKKGKLWYLGYVVAAGFLVALFVLKNSAVWGIICSMGFAGIFSATHVNVMHEKMLEQDADYQRNIKDERNIMIREKAGNSYRRSGVCTAFHFDSDYRAFGKEVLTRS